MDFMWLGALRRALLVTVKLRPYMEMASGFVGRLAMMAERREAERLRNDAVRLRNLESYLAVVGKLLAVMKKHGASDGECRTALDALMLPAVQSHLEAWQAIVQLQARHAQTLGQLLPPQPGAPHVRRAGDTGR